MRAANARTATPDRRALHFGASQASSSRLGEFAGFVISLRRPVA